MSEQLVSKHILIEGKVQGVFFRKHTKEKAKELHVVGWVKNTKDDKVEINVQGNKADIEKFVEWCKQGPPKAEVTNINIEETETDKDLKEFVIVYDD